MGCRSSPAWPSGPAGVVAAPAWHMSDARPAPAREPRIGPARFQSVSSVQFSSVQSVGFVASAWGMAGRWGGGQRAKRGGKLRMGCRSSPPWPSQPRRSRRGPCLAHVRRPPGTRPGAQNRTCPISVQFSSVQSVSWFRAPLRIPEFCGSGGIPVGGRGDVGERIRVSLLVRIGYVSPMATSFLRTAHFQGVGNHIPIIDFSRGDTTDDRRRRRHTTAPL